MITDAILGIFQAIVDMLLGNLPTLDLPDTSGMVDSISAFWQYAAWGNKYVPLIEIVGMVGVLVAARVVMFLFSAGVWLYEHLPFVG